MNRSRWQFSISLAILLLTGCADICYSATYSGIVVDGSNGGKAVPGVLVAAGYGLDRTVTDGAGRFSLAVDESGNHSGTVGQRFPNFTIKWNMRQRSLDLTAAPEITTVAIYRPNGVRLWNESFYSSNGKRIVTTPPMAPGLCLVTVTRSDNSRFTWRSLQGAGGGCRTFTLPSYGIPSISTAAISDKGITLVFRHDDYFPYDKKLGTPAEDLVIAIKPDPGRFVFDRTRIHSYSFTVAHDDSVAMEKNASEEQYVPAEFSFDSVPFGKVGLRFKGSEYYLLKDCFDSLGRVADNPLCAKVSMKVKFDKYNDTARFFSLKRLNMHAISDDQSKMHEMLCYRLFRSMGIYAPRTAYIKILVNGILQGLFVAVEEIDGRFTKSRWPDFGDGNLFKEVWPKSTSRAYFEDGLVTNNNPEDSGNGIRMADFSRAILSSSKETFVQNVSQFMDLDYWVRYIVVDRAIHNADGIMTWYCDKQPTWIVNHNYYFYQEENPGGKIWLIPWDLPATLSKTDPIIDDAGMPDWFVEPDTCAPKPIWNGGIGYPPHCDKLTALTADALWDNFVKAGEQFLAAGFKAERLQKEIDDYVALIEPIVAQDQTIDLKQWQNNVKYLRTTMTTLTTAFDGYIHKKTAAVDTAGYATPFPGDSGFTPGLLNNFEFGPEVSIDSWAHANISENSSINLLRDTVYPLGGKADLRCTFSLRPADTTKEYSEWVMLMLDFRQKTDCSGSAELQISLQNDVTRQVSIGLKSDVYARHGIGDGEWYCWTVAAGPKARRFTLNIRDIDYPEWVTHDRPALLDSVLAELSGIWISPSPFYGGDGELQIVPDSGFLKIDNIRFAGMKE